MKNTPTPLPPRWHWHHRALLRLQATLRRELAEHGTAARQPIREGSPDFADSASDETDHDTLIAELKHEDTELHEIEAALERLRLGTYGVCEATGEPIAEDRLRAIPWTRFSKAAAARQETSQKRGY
jgi:RNA polymerase-binding transcription factor DksA